MWLDRLASQGSSAPSAQPTNRAYSPLPRRTSGNLNPYVTSQRTNPPQRGSSVSLVSNASTTSLLGPSRKQNGAALKRSSSLREGPAPEDILEKILGGISMQRDSHVPVHTIDEQDLEATFDFGGLSLKDAARADFSKPRPGGPRRPQTTQEFEEENRSFEALHKSIADCDSVLSSVETSFTKFRNDLAAVSADIESLQNRSAALNVRLENRKAVEKALNPVIDDLVVSPTIVSKIVEGPLNESWIKALAEVDKTVASYHKESASPIQGKARSDLGPLLDKLVMKAVERIRDYLVAQIKGLRSPHINAQIIQQQNFLRVKDAYSFLYKHHSTLGEEICQAYMNTMRWYYLNQFTRYHKALDKLKLHAMDKNDVLGHEDASRKSSLLGTGKSVGRQHDAFSLGRRMDHLTTVIQTAIPSYLAEEDKSTHYLEVPFRNFNLALVDNASAEYTFLTNFFSPPMSLSTASKHFNYIFEPTFALGHTLTKSVVGDTFDGLGLLLCIRLNQRFAFELQRRKIPTVDGYINGTNMLLWPRLQLVMDHHSDSVRQLTNAAPSRPTARSSSEQAKLSAAPHVVAQRFGQFLQGILSLSAEAGDDEPVVSSLRRLRSEVETFLTKHSKMYADKRKQERFLYSNYSLILTIIGDASGKLAEEQREHFETLKTAFQEGA